MVGDRMAGAHALRKVAAAAAYLVLTGAPAFAQSPAPAPAAPPPPHATRFLREEATFQLALTLKLRADLAYLDDRRVEAKDLYAKGKEELDTLGPEWKVDHEARVALLAADIAYRQKLLEYQADFWGATYSLKPISPVDAFLNFEADLKQFEEVVGKISEAKDKLSNAGSASATLEGYRAAANTEADAQRLVSVTEEIKGNNHAAKATAAQARIETNLRRQREIAQEREKLAAEFDAAHRAFDALIVDAAMQAAGVPPEIQQLGQSNKPLEERILAAAGTMLKDNGPLVRSFGKLSETTANIVQTAQELQKELEALQKLQSASQATLAAVRKGTIEGALEAGTLIYGQLPREQQEQLAKLVVDNTKPVVALVETAKGAKSTLDTVVKVVADSDEMKARMRKLLEERLRENAPAFDQWYRKQLQAVVREIGPVPDLRVAEQAVRAWPKAFFSQLPKSLQDQLKTAAGAATYEEAARQVFGQWPPRHLTLQVEGGALQVRVGSLRERVDLRAFVERQAGFNLEAIEDFAEDAVNREVGEARDRMVAKVGGLLDPAMRQKDLFVKRFAQELDGLDASSSLARLLPDQVLADATAAKQEGRALFDKLWSELPAEGKQVAATQLAAVQAGAIAGKKVLADAGRQPPRGSVGQSAGGKAAANAAQQQMVMQAAITAAVPGAAVYFTVAKAMESFGRMNSLADRINRLTAEDRAIMGEQIALYDLVRDERAAVALAEMGQRVADLRSSGATRQAERYGQAVWQMDEKAKRAVGAQRLFAPRAYLLAERLRARYDQLDRSLAFWTGDPRATRGHLARLTQQDPQYLRYELDPAIQAFSWLDRSGESDRGDLPKLVEEWKRKQDLARLACEKLGCTPQTRQVGEVTTSAPQLSLRTLLPDQWAKFEQWKAGNSPDDEFTFEFLLTPAMLNPHKEHHGLRFVAARAAVKHGGALVTPGGNALRHSGAAYVPYEDTFVKEHYVPDAVYDLNDRPFSNNLARRWQTSAALRKLEGYGVYTLWRFSLRDAPANRAADDVVLQLAYQYRVKESYGNTPDDSFLTARKSADAAWTVSYRTPDAMTLKIGLAELPFFSQDARALETLRALLKEPEAAQAVMGKPVLQEEKGGAK